MPSRLWEPRSDLDLTPPRPRRSEQRLSATVRGSALANLEVPCASCCVTSAPPAGPGSCPPVLQLGSVAARGEFHGPRRTLGQRRRGRAPARSDPWGALARGPFSSPAPPMRAEPLAAVARSLRSALQSCCLSWREEDDRGALADCPQRDGPSLPG